jgi:hypothetical protein
MAGATVIAELFFGGFEYFSSQGVLTKSEPQPLMKYCCTAEKSVVTHQ